MSSSKTVWLKRSVAVMAVGVMSLAFAAPSAPVQGEVRRVNPNEGKITLKHGPIPELELPAMTLVFQVQDITVLEGVQPGDKVIFTADRINGQYTVITIRK